MPIKSVKLVIFQEIITAINNSKVNRPVYEEILIPLVSANNVHPDNIIRCNTPISD